MFPLNTELPLRGGGVAVLHEFFDGRWFGRYRGLGLDRWAPTDWSEDGFYWTESKNPSQNDILPPKRKAWVVWTPHCCEGPYDTEEHARQYAKMLSFPNQIQEITEP